LRSVGRYKVSAENISTTALYIIVQKIGKLLESLIYNRTTCAAPTRG
jgi:hypothetical protein